MSRASARRCSHAASNTPDPIFYSFSADCVEPSSTVSRYVLKVDIRDPGRDIRADFERFSVEPTEKRTP